MLCVSLLELEIMELDMWRDRRRSPSWCQYSDSLPSIHWQSKQIIYVTRSFHRFISKVSSRSLAYAVNTHDHGSLKLWHAFIQWWKQNKIKWSKLKHAKESTIILLSAVSKPAHVSICVPLCRRSKSNKACFVYGKSVKSEETLSCDLTL